MSNPTLEGKLRELALNYFDAPWEEEANIQELISYLRLAARLGEERMRKRTIEIAAKEWYKDVYVIGIFLDAIRAIELSGEGEQR